MAKKIVQKAFLFSPEESKEFNVFKEREKKAKEELLKYLEDVYDKEMGDIWLSADKLHRRVTERQDKK